MSRSALVLGLCLAASCSLEAGTGGERIDFEFSVQTSPSLAEPFENLEGWTVTLDQAYIAVGPAWLYENPPAAGHRRSPDWLVQLIDWTVPSAYAHPGDAFFDGGQLRGEFLEQHVFDLGTEGRVQLGQARGVAGECGTMTLVLDPPSSAIAGEAALLSDYPVWVSGQATREDEMGEIEAVVFAGGLDLDEDQRELTSITANFDLTRDDEVVLSIDARSWFWEAQFDRLEVEDGNGVMLIDTDSQVAIAWKLAVRNASNYGARVNDLP